MKIPFKEQIGNFWYKRIEPRILAQSMMLYLSDKAMHNTETGVSGYVEGKPNIIVSLTSYGHRIVDVPLVIESLLNQTLKPNKILLWLTEGEFNDDNLPILLKKQQARCADIRYCADIRSYKKLIPTLKEYPDDIIITVDDDIMYPCDLVENLYRAYLDTPDCVCTYRCHKMLFDKKGKLKPYNSWQMCYTGKEKGLHLFPTGVGGCLYPPHCFHEDILRDDLFTKLAPSADDVWFKAMTLLKGALCRKVPFGQNIIGIMNNQDIALQNENVAMRKNDIQIKQVFDYYDLWNKL